MININIKERIVDLIDLDKIQKFLRSEIKKNQPRTNNFNIHSYRTDIKTLVLVNYLINQKRGK